MTISVGNVVTMKPGIEPIELPDGGKLTAGRSYTVTADLADTLTQAELDG
jgi:hypothetical protein